MKNLKNSLLIVAIIISLQATAQNEKLSIGVKLLPGISNTDQKLINTSWKFTYGAGMQMAANFNKVIGIESGIYFRNYGFASEMTYTDNDGQSVGSSISVCNYNYLSIPVLLRINIHSFYFHLVLI